ncbi:AraC-like DNA-binding protein [Chitinophaga terrae (ex Kim and Jung 2007)]|uniref:helix-turn-helix transcriptional regulator n=1 Tax=Chitinophaga terrae (ex Kim and Jung 2007) TaxID=408074 RepID=UPI00278A8E33|nr:helix-turn-helix transcriptional regulator [Chitinophaga terrae (ex Kim and Jung 2007)]MDQ0107490.1 AraC-like DNA-binding protein [Chitinophaga terrae (ex Kim and Jung 2007)]
MNIIDPVYAGAVGPVSILPAEYTQYSIPELPVTTLQYDSSTIITQHITYDICRLWYYILDLRRPTVLQVHNPRKMCAFNFTLGSNITLFEATRYNAAFRQDHYELLYVPATDFEDLFPAGIYRFLQVEVTAELIADVGLDVAAIMPADHQEELIPVIYEGISLPMTVSMQYLLEKIFKPEKRGIMARVLIETATKDLMVVALSQLKERVYPTPHVSSSERQLFSDIKEFILKDLIKNVSVKVLCREFGISKGKLYSAFQRVYGASVSEFVRQQRIELAKRLLSAGTPVGDVAHKVGYTDTSNFSRVFKQQTGSTPTSYRISDS